MIILITDGIEACDEDPCAVSRALQAKGIVVKPFVIGMGIEEDMAKDFDASGTSTMLPIPRRLKTSCNWSLSKPCTTPLFTSIFWTARGMPPSSNVAYTFTDTRTEVHDPQWVHTMRWGKAPDTVYVDPLPTYAFTVHSTPPRTAGLHRTEPWRAQCFDRSRHGTRPPAPTVCKRRPNRLRSVRRVLANVVRALHSFQSPVGEELRLCTGTYDVLFPTHPPTLVRTLKSRRTSEAR